MRQEVHLLQQDTAIYRRLALLQQSNSIRSTRPIQAIQPVFCALGLRIRQLREWLHYRLLPLSNNPSHCLAILHSMVLVEEPQEAEGRIVQQEVQLALRRDPRTILQRPLLSSCLFGSPLRHSLNQYDLLGGFASDRL